jgi:predicted choloylglycine hydrolase
MRLFFIVLIMLSTHLCFGQQVTADKDSFAIIQSSGVNSITKERYFKLSKLELNTVDSIFKICASKNRLIHSRYKRQYFPYISKDGSKHVKVVCFCETNFNWKKNIVDVLDGGDCYFNVIINLDLKTYSDLDINGVA